MSEASTYQLLRGHLANLRLTAAAEALPAALERAKTDKLSHVALLESLMAIEVQAAQARRLFSLSRSLSVRIVVASRHTISRGHEK